MRTAADLSDGLRELIVAGRAAWQEREYARARGLFDEALVLAEASVDRFGQSAALHFLGNVAFNECRDDESRRLHAAALEIARADGDDQGMATSLGSIALIDVANGDLDAARARYDAAVEAYRSAGMSDAAESLRVRADDLLTGRVRFDEVVHRHTPADR